MGEARTTTLWSTPSGQYDGRARSNSAGGAPARIGARIGASSSLADLGGVGEPWMSADGRSGSPTDRTQLPSPSMEGARPWSRKAPDPRFEAEELLDGRRPDDRVGRPVVYPGGRLRSPAPRSTSSDSSRGRSAKDEFSRSIRSNETSRPGHRCSHVGHRPCIGASGRDFSLGCEGPAGARSGLSSHRCKRAGSGAEPDRPVRRNLSGLRLGHHHDGVVAAHPDRRLDHHAGHPGVRP